MPQSHVRAFAAGSHRRPRALDEAAARRRQGHLPPPRGSYHVPALLATTVLCVVADIYRVDPARLVAPDRDPVLVEGRRIVCQLLFERDCGPSAIARELGRNHSTILHSLRCLEEQMSPAEWDVLQMARRLVRLRLQAATPQATGGSQGARS